MAQTKLDFYLDTRNFSVKNNGYSMKFRLFHKGEHKYVLSRYFTLKEHFIYLNVSNEEYVDSLHSQKPKFVSTKHPNGSRINKSLTAKYDTAKTFLQNNHTLLKNYTAEELKAALQKVVDELNVSLNLKEFTKQDSTLLDSIKAKVNLELETESWGTKKSYESSLSAFEKFFAHTGKKDIKLSEIDEDWLREFDGWFKRQPGKGGEKMKPSSRYKRLSHIRFVIKAACKSKKETCSWDDYPFHDFKMPSNKTAKRAMDIKKLDTEQLEKNFNMDEVANIMDLFRQLKLEKGSPRWHYRNYLLFMWNARGMDFVDVSFLKKKSIYNKTLEYLRKKVSGEALAIVDLNEEAIEILEMYEYSKLGPDDYVFPIMREIIEREGSITEYAYERFVGKRKYFNKGITKMAMSIGLEKATSKMIRHTWAQDGFEEFESRDLIGEGLAHNSPQVTKIYARDLDRKRLVEANEIITERKSGITTVQSQLTIDLFKLFSTVQPEDQPKPIFLKRLKELLKHNSKKVENIFPEAVFTKWLVHLSELSQISFKSYSHLDHWFGSTFKSLAEQYHIRIITSDYNL